MVAIYHLSAKLLSRKSGRSATAAAAYRAGEKIEDQRTGAIHDYTRKRGVEHAELVMPSTSTWWPSRAELWNAVETKNKRGDAQVARELDIALPAELNDDQRCALAKQFAQHIADQYSLAVDVAIHAPDRKGDQRNHHAHLLLTTNRIEGNGLGNKAREWDVVARAMTKEAERATNPIEELRATWSALANQALERAGLGTKIDHRTLEAQGLDRAPTTHLGVAATGYERRTGEPSRRRIDWQEEAMRRLQIAREAGELERQVKTIDQAIIDLSGDLRAARRERDQLQAERQRQAGVERGRQVEQERQRRIEDGIERPVGKKNGVKAFDLERQRRIEALPTVAKTRAGAAYVLALRGQEAIKTAGGDAGCVDWVEVERAAIRESIVEHDQEGPDVLAAILKYSPAAADPDRHEVVRGHVAGAAAAAAAERERGRGVDDDGLELN